MPYIKPERREKLNNAVNLFMADTDAARFPSDLNYLIFKIAVELEEALGPRYDLFNDLIGALECCKQEMYRVLVAPYEEEKRQMNGDIK